MKTYFLQKGMFGRMGSPTNCFLSSPLCSPIPNPNQKERGHGGENGKKLLSRLDKGLVDVERHVKSDPGNCGGVGRGREVRCWGVRVPKGKGDRCRLTCLVTESMSLTYRSCSVRTPVGEGWGQEVRATEPLVAPKPVPAQGDGSPGSNPRLPTSGKHLGCAVLGAKTTHLPLALPEPSAALHSPVWRLTASDCDVVSRPPSKRNEQAPPDAMRLPLL